MMVRKGNHLQMALIQVSELLCFTLIYQEKLWFHPAYPCKLTEEYRTTARIPRGGCCFSTVAEHASAANDMLKKGNPLNMFETWLKHV